MVNNFSQPSALSIRNFAMVTRMAGKTINEEIGGLILSLLTTYAKEGIASPEKLSIEVFGFIKDEKLQNNLAETLYGATWVYSIGKLLAKDKHELQSHLRTQIINYGAVCEAVLEYVILEGAKAKVLQGERWQYQDEKMKQKLKWGSPPANLPKGTNFSWCIAVAKDESIFDEEISKLAHKLRDSRNSIHLNKKALENIEYEPTQSKEAYQTLITVIEKSQLWLAERIQG